MESDGTQGNGELIDSEQRRAVGGDGPIEAATLQAATKVIDFASGGNVWKRLSCRPFNVNVIGKQKWWKTLNGGRKLENQEKTHTDTGRTCRLHTERRQTQDRTDNLLAVRLQSLMRHHRVAQIGNLNVFFNFFFCCQCCSGPA